MDFSPCANIESYVNILDLNNDYIRSRSINNVLLGIDAAFNYLAMIELFLLDAVCVFEPLFMFLSKIQPRAEKQPTVKMHIPDPAL